MNYGEKLTKLKDSLGIKYFADYGKIVGVSGDWLNDNSKKDTPTTMVNIYNLIKIANYHNISLDYFFKDGDNFEVEISEEMKQNDAGFILEDLIKNIDNYNTFYGASMNSESKKILLDSIDVLKGLVRQKI